VEELIRKLLIEIGENPSRQGLENTPARVSESIKLLTSGYNVDVDEMINGAIFEADYSEMVILKDIELFSLCEHHMLPFFGKCHVAYIPDGQIIGLSKIARLVDVYAKRLQVQERLTMQIANTLRDKLNPKGVGVVIEAKHLCMIMRGVEKQNAVATTSAMLGAFRTHERTRIEFLELIKK
jgi:GTP cyclohydrolase IA